MVKEFQKDSEEQISEHFNVSEFKCKCSYSDCKITYLDMDLITYLENKRAEIGKPFSIMSGFRCTRHNADVGGKPGSIHMQGKAADITISGENMFKIADRFEDADGLGRYPGRHFVHCDKRGYHARWTG